MKEEIQELINLSGENGMTVPDLLLAYIAYGDENNLEKSGKDFEDNFLTMYSQMGGVVELI